MSRDLELYHMVETNQLSVEEALRLVENEAKEYNGTPDVAVVARIKELGGHQLGVATVAPVEEAVIETSDAPLEAVVDELAAETNSVPAADSEFYPVDEDMLVENNSLTDTTMVEELEPVELPAEEAEVVSVEPEGETLAEAVAPVEPEAEVAEVVSEVAEAVEPEAEVSEGQAPLM